jgi:ribosomal protein S16
MEPIVAFPVPQQAFYAGGRGENPTAAISSDGKVLHLRGRFVDKVAATATPLITVPLPPETEVLPRAGLSARAKKRMANWLPECREVAAEQDWEARARDPAFRRAFTETLLCGMTGMWDPAPEEVIMAAQVYSEYVFDFLTEGYLPSDHVNNILTTYGALIEQSLLTLTAARRLCRTEQGRLSQVRNEAREGDLFCVILGAEVPYLLRPSPGKPGVYTLVGDCFLHGVMQGEALKDGRYDTVDIVI